MRAMRGKAAKRNRPQALDNKENRETADSPSLMIPKAKAPRAKRFVSLGEMICRALKRKELRKISRKPLKSLERVNLCAGAGAPEPGTSPCRSHLLSQDPFRQRRLPSQMRRNQFESRTNQPHPFS
jgi:hypothetical protein